MAAARVSVSVKQAKLFGGVGYDVNSLLKAELPSNERAEILKARFAETIAKAKATLRNSDSGKQHEELEKSRRLGEKKLKLIIRKEELKKEADLKRKREEEREAARKALDMVERNVDVEDNFRVMRELEELMGGGTAWADLGLSLVEEGSEDEAPLKMRRSETTSDSQTLVVRIRIPGKKMAIGGIAQVGGRKLVVNFKERRTFRGAMSKFMRRTLRSAMSIILALFCGDQE